MQYLKDKGGPTSSEDFQKPSDLDLQYLHVDISVGTLDVFTLR